METNKNKRNTSETFVNIVKGGGGMEGKPGSAPTLKIWTEHGEKEGSLKILIDQDNMAMVNEYYHRHCLKMHFVGQTP
eukprot:c49806_g1_i1 orf=3-233(-)